MLEKLILVVAYFVLFQPSESLQASNYTIQSANEYIAANKDKVNQQYRLKYHFMPPLGWTNDPNGFIFYKGEYHLFYQFDPYGTLPNKIHWGHAKTKDLLNWEHLPVALAPDQSYDKDGVFSGSAIEKDGKLYIIYTGNTLKPNKQEQCVAYSEDGIVFNKISQNPVLTSADLPNNAQPQDFRDPKVFKHENTFYIVTASKTTSNTGQILLYQSEDLIKWRFKSILLQGDAATGVMWECPDLFELDGKYVLIISPIEMPRSGNHYQNYDSVIAFIGSVNWDTGVMTVEVTKEIDHGMDFYAPQSTLDSSSRRIFIAWMNMWRRNYPTDTLKHGWTGSMTIPRELHIKNNALVQTPAGDFNAFFKNSVKYEQVTLENEVKEFDKVNGAVGLIDLVIKLNQSALFSIELRKGGSEKTVITYDASTHLLELDRRASGILLTGDENPPTFTRRVDLPLENNILKLKILLDQSSVEIFANDGVETFSANIYPVNKNAVGITFGVVGKGVLESMRFSYTAGTAATSLITLLLVLPLYLIINNSY